MWSNPPLVSYVRSPCWLFTIELGDYCHSTIQPGHLSAIICSGTPHVSLYPYKIYSMTCIDIYNEYLEISLKDNRM